MGEFEGSNFLTTTATRFTTYRESLAKISCLSRLCHFPAKIWQVILIMSFVRISWIQIQFREWRLLGLNLGFQTIAVCIKDKIHTAGFMTWFFKKTAFLLLFGVLGGADRHVILFTIVGFRTTHLECLLVTGGWLYDSASTEIISNWDRFVQKLLHTIFSVLITSRNHARLNLTLICLCYPLFR